MAIDPHAEAALALHRFGMGPRAGSIAAIASDPRGALLAELERPGAGHVAEAGLMTSAQASRAVFEFRQERAANTKVAAERKRLADSQRMDDAPPAELPPTPGAQAEATPPLPQQIFLQESKARLDAAFEAEIGFVERLVWFWSNHFCISADKILVDGGRLRARSDPRRMCSAASPTCCWRSKAIRRCCSISTMRLDRSAISGRHQPQPRAERESRARDPRTAYARRAHGATRRMTSSSSPGVDRLDYHSGGRRSGAWRRIHLHPRMHEPGPQTGTGQDLR